LAFCLACAAVLWIALRLRPSRVIDVEDGPSLWSPWAASAGGNASRPRCPLSIHDITAQRRKILRWLAGFDVPDGEAPDVAQRVTYGAWRSRATYDPDSADFDSWLYAITFNHAAVYHRSAYARRIRLTDPAQGPWIHASVQETPEDDLAFAEQRRRAAPILARLAPKRAEVLVRHDYNGETIGAIAADEGLSCGALQSRLSYARADFARELRREEAKEQHLAAVAANERARSKQRSGRCTVEEGGLHSQTTEGEEERPSSPSAGAAPTR
jgi:RNA polymerase sigma factor (sigma-70 family)